MLDGELQSSLSFDFVDLTHRKGHFKSSIRAKAIEWGTKSAVPYVSFAWANTRATSSFWASRGVMNLAPIGSASLRSRRSILSPGGWVKPSSAPSARSFRAIAHAKLKSLATPRISAFLPGNNPIPRPLSP
jgi:hypothetical protein